MALKIFGKYATHAIKENAIKMYPTRPAAGRKKAADWQEHFHAIFTLPQGVFDLSRAAVFSSIQNHGGIQEVIMYNCCRFKADALSWHCSLSRRTHGVLHRLHASEGIAVILGRISGSSAAGEQSYYKGYQQSTIPFLGGIQKVLRRLYPRILQHSSKDDCQPAAAATDR